MTLHVIGIIANFKSILIVQVCCAKAFVAFICFHHRGCCRAEDVVAQRILSRRGCCRAEDVVAQRMLSRRGCCRAEDVVAQRMLFTEDVVAQRMLSRRGCCRAEDVVVQRMLSHRGCCRAEDVVTQRMLSCKEDVCCRAEDVVAQRIFLCTGYRARCVNDWFSGQLQDHFLTNWRGILKIPERFLSRKNQIIKTSLIFEKGVMDWDIRRNI
jgi:hypothetical protein